MRKLFLLMVIAGFGTVSLATTPVNVGDKAPVFSGLDENGDVWNSENFVGKDYLVVYFYPAAMTGGCTAQACAYRDFQDEFSGVGAKVIGISGDEPKNLVYFKKANNLNFTLLSDLGGEISKAFGVETREGGTIQREIAGAKVDLTRSITSMRWTFIIDKKGNIVYKDDAVNAQEDSKNTLETIKKLIADNN